MGLMELTWVLYRTIKMLPLMAPLALLLLLPLFFLLLRAQRNKASLRLPPSPPRLPIIGNLHQLGKHPHQSLHHLATHHAAPLMYLQLGRTPAIVVSTAEMAKEILKTHDLDSCSRPALVSWKKLAYGLSDVAFAPYDDHWRELRKICITELLSSKKIQSFRVLRAEEIDRMINSISDLAVNRFPVDLSEMLLFLSSNIICRAALGRSYSRSTAGDQYEWSRVHHMLKEVPAMLGGFFVADYFLEFSWVDWLTGMRARLNKICLELDGFYQEVIDQHLLARKQALQDEDITDALLRVQRDAAHITDDRIKGVLMDVFVAGAGTSSASVEWALTELMRHPTAMKTAQDEVRGFIGTKGKVEESDLQHLPYLKMVVNETMRIHPPAPLLIQRETVRRFSVDGYDIPAKALVLVNALAIGRDASCWDKPEEFYPERFAHSSVDLKGNDFQLIPFGAGRRICPGMQFGLLTVELALANLLYSFNWELPKGVKGIDMDEAIGVTVHRKSPLILAAAKYGAEKADM